jgi:peptidoglycan/LPS O-acetylase OafA/YrhL/glycosyltransferase involved in cell wall biosynthesis
MPKSRVFLNNLQALRAYAALSVILVHLIPLFGFHSPFGHYGVDLFFVLSGFLMAMIAATDPEEFLLRRLIRIVPVYWLLTVGVFFLALLAPNLLHSTKPDCSNLVKSLLFVPYRKENSLIQPMLNVGWTLNYEIYFYTIFAVVLWLKLPRPSFFAALMVSVLPALAWVRPPTGTLLEFYSQPIVFDFVLGMASFHLLRNTRPESGSVRFELLALAALMLLLPCIEMANGFQNRQIILAVPAAAIVYLAVRLENKNCRITNPLILMVGDASYVLYLTQIYVLQAGEKILGIGRHFSGPFEVFCGLLLVVVAVLFACGFHLCVERPLLRILRRRFLKSGTNPPNQPLAANALPANHSNARVAGRVKGVAPLLGILWAQYGPYHHARVAAFKKLAGPENVHAMEVGSKTAVYAWNASAATVELITLCPGAVAEQASFWRVFRNARRIFSDLKLEVCILPSYWPMQPMAALLAAKSLGIRTVMMNESHAGTARARGLGAWFKRRLVSLFDAALVGGLPQKRYIADMGLEKEKIFTGYDAVDNNYFCRRAAEVRTDALETRAKYGLPEHYFLSLGRLVPKKNLATLLYAYAKVLGSKRDSRTHLVLVGSGEEEPALRNLCRELGLSVYDKTRAGKENGKSESEDGSPGVHFYGFRQIEENPLFYGLADVFILPSLYEEWGLVVNEAMASGLPVVVSETAGCAEDLLRPGRPELPDLRSADAVTEWGRLSGLVRRNGFVFDPESSDALAAILTALASSRPLREVMGRNSLIIIEDYSCEVFARNALLAVQAATGENPASPATSLCTKDAIGEVP